MKKKIKKAFTLVELLVVIAILAILATVSIVGYTSFVEKANKSVDEQLCAQYNTLLKAESVSNNDITLPEFITLVEENGINSNQFKTSSKSYVFAYDAENVATVLLDKDSGEVKYPANHPTNTELWTVYPDNGRLQVGVYNYALLTSVIYNSNFLNFENKDYTFDLNNNAIEFKVAPTQKITVTNGTLVKTVSTDKVVGDDTTVVIDTTTGNDDWGKITEEETPTKLFEGNATKVGTTITVENKYYGSSYTGNTPSVTVGSTSLGVTLNENDTVVFSNCVFTNIGLSFSAGYNYEIRNCTFMNLDKSRNAITMDYGVKSYKIVDNKVVNCVRSFNLCVPQEDSVVSGNTFTLNAITSIKDERKDNAIQFYSNKDALSSGEVGNVVVENNVVEKANSFIQLHVSFVAYQTGSANTAKYYKTPENCFNTLKEHVVFRNNTIKNNISKVQADPGVKTDFKDKTVEGTTEKFDCEELERILNGYCNQLDIK